MTVFSSFEILAQTLVPPGIPVEPNPFLIQGYFVEVSLSPYASVQSAIFNIVFQETTDFQQGNNRNALQAQIIGADGDVSIYKDFFASTGRGFLAQSVSRGQTVIFGVQALPSLSDAKDLVSIPQGGIGWRGTVQINASAPTGSLIATPTQRQVFYQSTEMKSVISASAYALPTATGNIVI
jgi:hypothetical protein